MLAPEEGDGGLVLQCFLQAGIWGCRQCLALMGSNLIALNHHIWGRREQMAHYMENFSAYCSKEAVTWPLSLGASGSAGTSNFGAACSPQPCVLPGHPPHPQSGSVQRHELAHVSGGKAYELCKTQRRCRVYSCEIFPVN